MNKSLSPHSSRASGGIIKLPSCLVFIMSPLQGFRMVKGYYPAVALHYTAGYSSCRR
jgi:hypothetical protein